MPRHILCIHEQVDTHFSPSALPPRPTSKEFSTLTSVLRLRPRTPSMLRIRMPAELQLLLRRQLDHLLEILSNLHQHLLRLALAPLALPDRSSPQPDPIESLAHVDHHAHDLVVAVLLEGLPNRSELRVQPELVNVHGGLVAPAVGPFATMLILRVLPFGADALFEEVVIGLLGEVGAGRDVVLEGVSVADGCCDSGSHRFPRTPRRCRM